MESFPDGAILNGSTIPRNFILTEAPMVENELPKQAVQSETITFSRS